MSSETDFLPRKLLWVDLEMTGLDPKVHRIVELAAIVTDFDFNELESLEVIIHQPDEVLDKSNPWAKDQHQKSGLWENVQNSQISEKESEKQLVQLIDKYFDDNFSAVLSGNSIHQDRQFIRSAWPEVEGRLHYRMLDVSSFKLIMQAKYGVFYNKKEAHRALGDIRESIGELKHYLQFIKK